jgi:C_GCAxxG_C_C family probable redox protein
MQRNSEAGQKAFEYHKSGFHCAEAVLKAIVEVYGNGSGRNILKIATGFGGGIGRTKQEICGAITGGVMAIGFLSGRSEPGADWTEVSEMAAKLKRRFVQEHGTTKCCALLATFGPQKNMLRCKQLSGEVADMLTDIIDKQGKD